MVRTLPRAQTLVVAVSLEKVLSAIQLYSPESIRLMSHSSSTDRTKLTPCLVSMLSNILIRGLVRLVRILPSGSTHVTEGTGSPSLMQVMSTDCPGSIPMSPEDTTILTGTAGNKHHCYISHQVIIVSKKQTNKRVNKQTSKQTNE